MNLANLVEARHLRRLYTRAGRTLAAVDNVDFTMAAGESVSLMGASGSGKTTFLGLLTGLISPTSGEIVLDGRKLAELPDAAASRLRRSLVGYVPQGRSLIPSLNALDNTLLPCFLGDGEQADAVTARALDLLRAVGLAHLRDALPRDMSGGEMRRVAIARALIRRPRLLVADEPTSDLDEANADAVMRLLAEANAQGAALLVATHDRRLAELAGRRLVMAAGKLSPA